MEEKRTHVQFCEALGGGRWHGRYGTCFCPAHDNRPHAGDDGFPMQSMGGLLAHCHAGCDFRGGHFCPRYATGGLVLWRAALARHGLGLTRRRSSAGAGRMRRPRASGLRAAQRLWNEAQPAPGSPVESLSAQGAALPPHLPESLRYHHACWHSPSRRKLPAMVFCGTDGRRGCLWPACPLRFTAPTWRPDGYGDWRKARVEPAKMMPWRLRAADTSNCARWALISRWWCARASRPA